MICLPQGNGEEELEEYQEIVENIDTYRGDSERNKQQDSKLDDDEEEEVASPRKQEL